MNLELESGWEEFRKDEEYEAFLVKLKDINTNKKPVVLVDKSLDFFNDKVLFPQKLEKANEMLKKVGLPVFHKKSI